jgi:hypothetical protein
MIRAPQLGQSLSATKGFIGYASSVLSYPDFGIKAISVVEPLRWRAG